MTKNSESLDLPDVNVLVALHLAGHQHHAAAHAWFETAVGFATTPITEAGLVRLWLNPAVVGEERGGEEALTVLAALGADPRWSFLPDDASFRRPLIGVGGLSGHRQVTDLHLANLVAGHGARLVTFDRRLAASLAAADRSHVHLLPAEQPS